MKLFIGLAALCSSFFMSGDKYEYFTANHDYSFSISTNSRYEQVKKDDGGYQDFIYIYDGKDTTQPAYLVSVVKVPGVNVQDKDLFDTVFTNSFQANCGCSITATAAVDFKNVHGMQITMKMDKDGNIWLGYSINIVKGSALYSIDFLSSDKTFEKYKGEYKEIMNSMKIYK